MAEVFGCPVRAAKDQISQLEFYQWLAYFSIQDETEHQRRWGRDKQDWLIAYLVWTIRAMMCGKDGAGEVRDHLLEFRDTREQNETPKRPNDTELGAKLLAWAAMNKAKDLRNANRNASDKANGG